MTGPFTAVVAVLTAALLPAAGGEAVPAKVSGRVVDAQTGRPIAGVRITLLEAVRVRTREEFENQRVYSVRTAADGRFVLSGIPPGRYRFTAWRRGYLTQDWRGKLGPGAASVLSLHEGDTVGNVTFRLQRSAVISGRVTDLDGEPVAEALVRLYRAAWSRGRRILRPDWDAETDDRGLYRLFYVRPGRYYLGLYVSGGDADAILYWPGSWKADEAQWIEVKPGDQSTGVDFVYRRPVEAGVRGRVALPAGAGGRNVVVSLLPATGEAWSLDVSFRVVDPETGRFELHLLPGRYALVAKTTQGSRELFGFRLIDVPPAGVEGLEVPLQPGMDVAGRVDFGGEPIPGPGVTLSHAEFQPGFPRSARAGKDGRFLIRNVVPGRHQISIGGLPARAYVFRVLWGDEETTGAVEIGSGAPPAELRIQIRQDARPVRGRVRDPDGEPVAGAAVLALPPPGRWRDWDAYRLDWTDQNGAFRLEPVPPGWLLAAFDDLDSGLWQAPGFVSKFAARAVRLEDVGAEVELTLQSIGE